nr:MAG TPA: YopX protein [Caudoviricetes sp.]
MIVASFGIVTGIVYTEIDKSTQELIKHGAIIEDVVLERATGVRDKKRKMIYEGDIVEHDVYHVGIKAYRSKSEVFISDLGAIIREDRNDEECSLLRHCTDVVVVGNINESL